MAVGDTTGKLRDLARRIDVLEDMTRHLDGRVVVFEQRIERKAPKAWVIAGAVAGTAIVLAATAGGFWWIVQAYLAPLLRASAG